MSRGQGPVPGQTVPGETVHGRTVPGQTAPGDAAPGETAPGDAALDIPGAEVRDAEERWPVVGDPQRVRGAFVTLRTDQVLMPDGETAPRDVIEHPGAVAVVALDERDQVLLIRQYRHPAGQLLWEIPAGIRDVDGEEPRATAERELLEEAGYRARDWCLLADFFSSPGITTERLQVFLARGLTLVPEAERGDHIPRHEEAHLLVRWVPLRQAVELFLAGDLHNGVTAVGILSAYAAHKGGYAALRKATLPER